MTDTEIDTDTTTDLDSLDTSMDKIYCHLTPYQQGATTIAELMTLPKVIALCGFTYKMTKQFPQDTPLACPQCMQIWYS